MTVQDQLDSLFEDMLAGRGTKRKRRALKESINESHVELLLRKIESIGDPSDYCDDDETHVPVNQFFEFVDYVSALIINLGEAGRVRLDAYPDSRHEYLKWVRKYVTDERFHAQVMQQLQ